MKVARKEWKRVTIAGDGRDRTTAVTPRGPVRRVIALRASTGCVDVPALCANTSADHAAISGTAAEAAPFIVIFLLQK